MMRFNNMSSLISSHFSFVLALILIPTSCRGQLREGHVALFIFGDSLYDAGNNYYISSTTPLPNLPPYGETFLPYPTGRFSDGRLVPDFIAQHAHLTLLPPYLQPGFDNYTNGVNFASAGSGILNETRVGTLNLTSQLGFFETAAEKLKEQLGEDDAKKLLANAVYLFSAGGNDILAFDRFGVQSPAEYFEMMNGNFTTVIEKIYDIGGRKFGIQNVGPMGCSPSNRAGGTVPADECATELQDLSVQYNILLSELMESIAERLPDFHYSLFDYFTSLMERTLYYSNFGFLNGPTACCGTGLYNGDFTCGRGEYNLCNNPCTHVWWDAGHPTEHTNMQIANLFWSGNDTVVKPINLSTLFGTSVVIGRCHSQPTKLLSLTK